MMALWLRLGEWRHIAFLRTRLITRAMIPADWMPLAEFGTVVPGERQWYLTDMFKPSSPSPFHQTGV